MADGREARERGVQVVHVAPLGGGARAAAEKVGDGCAAVEAKLVCARGRKRGGRRRGGLRARVLPRRPLTGRLPVQPAAAVRGVRLSADL